MAKRGAESLGRALRMDELLKRSSHNLLAAKVGRNHPHRHISCHSQPEKGSHNDLVPGMPRLLQSWDRLIVLPF